MGSGEKAGAKVRMGKKTQMLPQIPINKGTEITPPLLPIA
jgi:hypothetical protein